MFPKCILTTAFIGSILFSFGQTTQITRLDGSRISYHQIDSLARFLMDTANVAGLSLAVLQNNRVAFTRSYGFKNKVKNELLDTASVLYAASFSKAVFAYLTLKLVDEMRIDLDKPLYSYLSKPIPAYPYYADLADDNRWKLITARMCLSHTTGLPNVRYINVHTGEDDSVGTMHIYFQPGSRYAYSGEGLKLLQLVEEEVTGRSLEDLAIEKIFIPAGMMRTGYIWHERFNDNFAIGHLANGKLNPKSKKTVPVSAGSMVTTIADFSRFVEYVMQKKGLQSKTWRAMLTPQIKINSLYQFPTITDLVTRQNDDIHLSYGLGWGLLQTPYGQGFFKEGHDFAWRNYTINFPDKGLSIVIMSNSENAELIFKDLLTGIIGDRFTPFRWERFNAYNEKPY